MLESTQSVKYIGITADRYLSGEITVYKIVTKFLNSQAQNCSSLSQCRSEYICSLRPPVKQRFNNKLENVKIILIRLDNNMGRRERVNQFSLASM